VVLATCGPTSPFEGGVDLESLLNLLMVFVYPNMVLVCVILGGDTKEAPQSSAPAAPAREKKERDGGALKFEANNVCL